MSRIDLHIVLPIYLRPVATSNFDLQHYI